jgi:hypothetical protein
VRRATTALFGDMAGVLDERHQGLRCRADPLCDEVFHVAHNALTTAAALLRNAHELAGHGYVHVEFAVHGWDFTSRFSKGGRSTMGAKR